MVKDLIIVILSIVTLGLLVLTFKQHRELAAVVEPSAPATYAPPKPVEPVVTEAGTQPVAKTLVQHEAAPEAVAQATRSEVVESMVRPETTEPNAPIASEFVEMMKQPEFKELMRAQQKMQMDQTYGELFSWLELEGEDRDTMKQLLSDHEANVMDMGMAVLSNPRSSEETEELGRRMMELQNAFEEDVRAFLGDEDFDLYKQYEYTKGERRQVDRYKELLGSANQLEWEQEHELILAMHEERTAFDFSTPRGGDASEVAGFPSSEQIQSQMEDMRELHQRYINRAEGIVNQDQLAHFKTSLDQSLAMQEMSLKMAGKMFRAKEEPASEAETGQY